MILRMKMHSTYVHHLHTSRTHSPENAYVYAHMHTHATVPDAAERVGLTDAQRQPNAAGRVCRLQISPGVGDEIQCRDRNRCAGQDVQRRGTLRTVLRTSTY